MTNTPYTSLKTLTVEAQYLERIGLRRGSVFSLKLQDVAKLDTAAVCIARQDIMSTNPAHTIELRYDERALEPQGRYQLVASAEDPGRLKFRGAIDIDFDQPKKNYRLVMNMVITRKP